MLEYIITFISTLFIVFIVFIFSYAFMNTKIELNIDDNTEKKLLKIMYSCVLFVSIIISYIYYYQQKQNNNLYSEIKNKVLNVIEIHDEEFEHSSKLYDDVNDIFE